MTVGETSELLACKFRIGPLRDDNRLQLFFLFNPPRSTVKDVRGVMCEQTTWRGVTCWLPQGEEQTRSLVKAVIKVKAATLLLSNKHIDF